MSKSTFTIPAILKTMVVTFNALILLMLLKTVLLARWSQPTFISLFTLLFMVAPFATTILYAVSVRNFLVWYLSLGANLLMVVLVTGFTLLIANITGGYNSSLGVTLIKLLVFIGVLSFINAIYLLFSRPKKIPASKPTKSAIG